MIALYLRFLGGLIPRDPDDGLLQGQFTIRRLPKAMRFDWLLF
jgi:hypothetical protein